MKLFTEFRKQINRLGAENIRQAWFTSFNLSPHFVERYILQALAGQNEKLSSIADYEALQQKLLDQKMDIRFFSDAAAITQGENKRTFFNFHLVNPKLIDPRFGKGVFHPKVIFLRTEDGSAIIGTGSANLTVSGWGRNREIFIFRKINNATNRDRILKFFKSLFQATNIGFPDLDIKLDGDGASRHDWLFLSSLNHDRLFDHLQDGKGDRLLVWSPYFSNDIVAFKKNHIDPIFGQDVKMEIFPDIVDQDGSPRIRIPDNPALRDKLSHHPDIRFRKMNWQESDLRLQMTHAKLWQFGRKIAIGSWNCTQAGTNVHLHDQSGESTTNIEAGILMSTAIDGDIEASKIEIEKYLMPEHLLKNEQDDLPQESDRLSFFLEVRFSWIDRTYKITVKYLADDQGWELWLPGKKGPVPLPGGQESLVVEKVEADALLTKRVYEINRTGYRNNPIKGIILEEGCCERPVYKFENFNVLLDAWNTERLIERTDSLTPRAAGQAEGYEETGIINTGMEAACPDYFRMFRAFQNMQERLYAEKNRDELRRLIQTYPGSLLEVSEKIAEMIKYRQTQNVSSVYLWMLQMEFQCLLKTAREKADEVKLHIDWQAMHLDDHQVHIDGIDQRMVELAMKLAKYDRNAV